MEYKKIQLKDLINYANTGADAIQRAPIVEYDTGIKCIRIGDISNDRKYDEWGFTEITEENFNKYKLDIGDILIARTGSTIGISKIIKNEVNSVYNNGLIKVKVNKEKCNSNYFYYILQSKEFIDYIQGIAFGTTGQPNMKINDFLKYKTNDIPIDKQNKIVKILSKIDEKIDINNKINDNLLEFGLNGVLNECYQERVRLETLANVISKGTTPTGSDIKKYPNKDIKFIKVKDFNEYGVDEKNIELISNEIHTGKLKRSMLLEDDLLVSIAGTLGKIAIVTNSLDNANTNQAVAFVRLEKTINKGYLYFYMHTKEFQEDIIKKQVHAVQPNLSLTELGNIMVPVLRDENKNLYNVLLQKLILNVEENKKLEQLRDSLLPKLMNGEIDLDKIEI